MTEAVRIYNFPVAARDDKATWYTQLTMKFNVDREGARLVSTMAHEVSAEIAAFLNVGDPSFTPQVSSNSRSVCREYFAKTIREQFPHIDELKDTQPDQIMVVKTNCDLYEMTIDFIFYVLRKTEARNHYHKFRARYEQRRPSKKAA